ncbi:TolB family protein [Micromonospora sp. DT48]|uniref:TolB family protein n=1 Tax=Micromonospora sp. DT48 TaxID=3393429 RepID=UPI003CFB1B1D
MRGTRWTGLTGLLVLAVVTGCTGAEPTELPVRVASVPTEVRGLGPAVLAVPVADDRRTDLVGLLTVEQFGDDLADRQPDRRHAEVAFGDPRYPTIARGLGDDRRDALLVGGRLRETNLPDHVYARRATGVTDALSVTASRCLAVTGDGTTTRPAVEATCTIARGGVVWQDRAGERYGAIDLKSGAASPAIAMPSHPIAASADGRYLAALTTERPPRLVIADTKTGRSQPTVTVSGRDVPGVFTSGGFAVLHRSDKYRTISLVTPDKKARSLLTPVGEVAFAPDGRRALVVDTRSGTGRIAVLDLASGTVTPVVDGTPDRSGTQLPPVTGSVTATVSGDTALVVELAAAPDVGHRAPRPSRTWSVRLSTATATVHPDTPAASSVTVRADDAAPTNAASVATASFQPDGTILTLSPDGTVTSAPPGATPRATLGDGAVWHALTDDNGDERAARLLVTDSSGSRTEVPTGAGPDQRIDTVILTPDTGHLLISLRSTRAGPRPGPLDTVVIVRRDGTGEPVTVYQGAVLASLGITPG